MNETKQGADRAASEVGSESAAATIHLRPAREADIPAILPLLLRLKHLNEEFDSLLKVRPDADEQGREVLRAQMSDPKAVILAAEGTGPDHGKVVGFVRAVVRERPFYEPEHEGVILDIYLLPLYRRRGVGEHVLQETVKALKAKGAGIVTAEFPAQNEIAIRFYAKRGFRPVTHIHARSL